MPALFESNLPEDPGRVVPQYQAEPDVVEHQLAEQTIVFSPEMRSALKLIGGSVDFFPGLVSYMQNLAVHQVLNFVTCPVNPESPVEIIDTKK